MKKWVVALFAWGLLAGVSIRVSRADITIDQDTITATGDLTLHTMPSQKQDIFYSVDASGGITIGTTETLIVWDTPSLPGDYYSSDGDYIQIEEDGDYLVRIHVTADNTGGGRLSAEWYITVNDVEVDGTRAATYHRVLDDGDDTASITAVLTLSSGDTIAVAGISNDSNYVVSKANGCRIMIRKL